MTRKTLFLHIGTHKTGSTALQQWLNGLNSHPAHPDTPSFYDSKRAYPRFLDANLDGGWLPKERRRLRAVLARLPARAVVMSNERFSGNPFQGYAQCVRVAENLAALTGDFCAEVIVFLRRQDKFFESLYLQSIHEGGSESFHEFARRVPPECFDWRRLVFAYADAFGEERLRVVPYDLVSQDVVEAFCARIGCPYDQNARSSVGRANTGYSAAAAQLARVCNPVLRPPARVALREILQSKSAPGSPRPSGFFTIDERRRLLRHFAPCNIELFQRFGVVLPKEYHQVVETETRSSSPDAADEFEKLVQIVVKELLEAPAHERRTLRMHRRLLKPVERGIKKLWRSRAA